MHGLLPKLGDKPIKDQKLWVDLVATPERATDGVEIRLIRNSLANADRFAEENNVKFGKPTFTFEHGALRTIIPYEPIGQS